jgi:hypothetical protein
MKELRGSGAITDTDWTFWPVAVWLSNPRAREVSQVVRFAWTTLYWNVAVILWGAYVRATGSGAGCGNRWPLCDADVVGTSAKAQTIVEFTHRITSVISLLAVTGLVVWCWRVTKKGDWARFSAVLAAALLANEALLGAALVLLKHVGNDQSAGRILFLCLHFGKFGPEYERAVQKHGSERKAEAKLADRQERVEKLNIRDLDPMERERFSKLYAVWLSAYWCHVS